MLDWLWSDSVVASDGAVASWWNPAHPGYSYPEAAGLWLAFAGGPARRRGRDVADRVALRLCAGIDGCGGVGRDGRTYVFDSAMALRGLIAYRRAGGIVPVDDACARLHAFVASGIADGVAVRPAAAGDQWSLSFQPHLLKTALALQAFSDEFDVPFEPRVASRLAGLALLAARRDRERPVYLHAYCYALEGLSACVRGGITRDTGLLDGLDWLAGLQRPDGSLPADAHAPGSAEPRCDATAQAARLWLLHGRDGFEGAIRGALAFLADCQAPCGGMPYSPVRDDVNTWTTLFAAQAAEWHAGGVRASELV
jgi:hypothetical protein